MSLQFSIIGIVVVKVGSNVGSNVDTPQPLRHDRGMKRDELWIRKSNSSHPCFLINNLDA